MSSMAVSAKNVEFVAHHDLGGFGDGMQVMRHRNALFVGHHGVSGMGTTILDVSDITRPELVDQWRAPEGSHTHKVQIADGLLLVNHERFPLPTGEPELDPASTGMAVYRLDNPFAPERIGFWETGGRGVHRIVWTGGRYAYLSAQPEGFSDRIWMIADLSDPAHPTEVSKWWWPGQWVGGGETATWPTGERIAAHHALMDGDIAYLGYDDVNLVVLDISDRSRPSMIANLQWDGGSTHTCLPLPGRSLLAVTDEQVKNGPDGPVRTIRIVDVHDPTNPRIVGVVPPPDASLNVAGARFGAHNLHENRPDSFVSEDLIFSTYFSAGLRVYDITDATSPREIAHWVPAPAAGKPAAASNDLYVDAEGLIYVTDRVGGGVAILRPTGELAAMMGI